MKRSLTAGELRAAEQQKQNTPTLNSGTDVRERLRALMLEKMHSSPRSKGNENVNTLNNASSRIPVLDKRSSDSKESPVSNSKVSAGSL